MINLDAFNQVPVARSRPVVTPSFIIKLREILGKDLNVLTENDKDYIRARKSYLTSAQKDFYKDILEDKTDPDPEPTYHQLQAQAKAKGLKYVGVSFEALKTLLNN